MSLYKTDLEYKERLDYFKKEIKEDQGIALDETSYYLSSMAILLGCQGVDAFKEVIEEALNHHFDPVMIKETVYQATDYLGYGRALPFIKATNEVLEKLNINPTLESQATTTLENRLEKGVEAQVKIFGDHMQEAWKASKVNYMLAANCFGDYYTRQGLTLAQRELITFGFILAQGGCEPQLTAHIQGNMNIGNDAEFLTKVVLNCIPYIGYPRSLNAINCIKKVSEQNK